MKQPTPITIRDFLENKFGYFNPAHPLSHLGYAKGLTPDIEDLINAFEEYLHQPGKSSNKQNETAKEILKNNVGEYIFKSFEEETIYPQPSGSFPMIDLIYQAMQEYAISETYDALEEYKKIEAQQPTPAPVVLNNPTIEEIKNKYKKYISNIEWDTRTNERKGKAKELNDEQIKYYEEFLNDLRTLQNLLPQPTPAPVSEQMVYDLVAQLSFGGFLSDRITVEDVTEKINRFAAQLQSAPKQSAGVDERIALDIRKRVMHYNDDVLAFKDWFKEYVKTTDYGK